MAKLVAPGRLMIKDDNLDIHPKKAGFNVKSKNSKLDGKKGGLGKSGRKALNDISNKTSRQTETSVQKKNLPKEDVNIKEEMFLHDHKKCIEAQKAAMNNFNLETVLPQDDSFSILEQIKVPHSTRCYPEPEELPMSEFSDWLDYSMQWSSPPSSPLPWETLSSPFAWQHEDVEFVLKGEIDPHV
ncbi:protein PATRONUS 2-like [Lotus japonicus]|uniref:Protein PATRONUS 2 n=1 Tax=Lotus japonicus TaxID=34305 RepID=I3S1K7_LOTJA|nr:protein PATRONUS 2-like [Lotus japonicus]XP_057441406.1 protein PATRONUS 2-like [Lotus japonicus]AFK34149.1 unknown [Lotus japonicus]